MIKTVRDVMKPQPLSVDARTSIEGAAHLMRIAQANDVLVIDENGKLRGRITDSDIVVIAIAAGRHPATIPVGDCCNPELTSVAADESAERAAQIMRVHALDQLPVVDDGGQLVGLVSSDDLDGRPGG